MWKSKFEEDVLDAVKTSLKVANSKFETQKNIGKFDSGYYRHKKTKRCMPRRADAWIDNCRCFSEKSILVEVRGPGHFIYETHTAWVIKSHSDLAAKALANDSEAKTKLEEICYDSYMDVQCRDKYAVQYAKDNNAIVLFIDYPTDGTSVENFIKDLKTTDWLKRCLKMMKSNPAYVCLHIKNQTGYALTEAPKSLTMPKKQI
jgi:hypothetical protein